jgi:hypothetical protein
MSMPRHVNAGDPIRASHHNAVVDTLRSLRVTGSGLQVDSGPAGAVIRRSEPAIDNRPATVIQVRNTGAAVLQQYRPAIIAGVMFDADRDEFHTGAAQVYDAEPAASSDGNGLAFVVAIEPIQPEYVGRAVASGIVPCYLTGENANGWADLRPGESTSALTCRGGGQAQVLWAADGDADRLGVVRFPAGGGLDIEECDVFPALPDEPTLIWCHGGLWAAGPGSVIWRPLDYYTTATGVPGT